MENRGVAILLESRLFSIDLPTAGFFVRELERSGLLVVIMGVALPVTRGLALATVVRSPSLLELVRAELSFRELDRLGCLL